MKSLKDSKVDFNEQVLQAIKNSGQIKGKELAKLFGHRDTRQIRIAIQNLRLQGKPICVGKSGGYFYSTDPDHIKATVQDMLGRADEIMTVAESMSKALKQ